MARLDIGLLDSDTQRLLNYDPQVAAAAAEKRKADEAASAALLDDERQKIKALKQKQTAEEDATAARLAGEEKKQNETLEAAMRVDQAKTHLADYEDDLKHLTSTSVVVNSATGAPTGVYTSTGQLVSDSYTANKFDEDVKGIAECKKIIEANGY